MSLILKFTSICMLFLCPTLLCLTQATLKIQTKDGPQIYERRITSPEFQCRADSSATFFLILMDRNPSACDKQGYLHVSPPSGEFLQKKRYENFTGINAQGMKQPFLEFYYTEPAGIRYHCFDNLQTGWFEISELEFNQDGEVQTIAINWEIHCIVNGKVEQRASTGSLRHSEDRYSMEMTDMIESVKFLSEEESN